MNASSDLINSIKIDLNRTDPGNVVFLKDFSHGSNPLYNVLIAYANFDPEVNYCQGMNMVASWLLKHLDYNECDAFFFLVYICITHKWREVYKPEMTKIKEMALLLNEIISTTYPEVYEHLLKTSMLDVDQMI